MDNRQKTDANVSGDPWGGTMKKAFIDSHCAEKISKILSLQPLAKIDMLRR